MARIRTIKPEFFLHEGLYDLEKATGLPIRISFAGLFCQADREGRFRWQPRRLKSQIIPYDEVDFSRVLDALGTRGFIVKYASNGDDFGFIPTFLRHQIINNRESQSDLPEPTASSFVNDTSTRAPRVPHACSTESQSCAGERKGKERKGKEGDSSKPPCVSEPTSDGSEVIMVFPCVGRGPTEWPLTDAKVAEYRQSFPAVDVLGECRKARQWCIDNPTKRKTFGGMPAFVSRWLSRVQDSGGSNGKSRNGAQIGSSREQDRLDRSLGAIADFAASGDDTRLFASDGGPRRIEADH